MFVGRVACVFKVAGFVHVPAAVCVRYVRGAPIRDDNSHFFVIFSIVLS